MRKIPVLRLNFPSQNFSSLDWYFSQIPLPNMIYLYITLFYLEYLINNFQCTNLHRRITRYLTRKIKECLWGEIYVVSKIFVFFFFRTNFKVKRKVWRGNQTEIEWKCYGNGKNCADKNKPTIFFEYGIHINSNHGNQI